MAYNRTRSIFIAIGLMQGLMLLLVHELRQTLVLGAADLPWLVPLYATAYAVPAALQLILTDTPNARVWFFGVALTIVLALTGMYTGMATDPTSGASTESVVIPYILTTAIGWYVLLPFVQTYIKTGTLRPHYADLFNFAWNNVITLAIAGLFTGIFWGLLALWAGLFHVIGIALFKNVFYTAYFAYPITAVVFAGALHVGRTNANAVVTVRRVVLAIFRSLLPLVAVLIVLFIAMLPFTGLAPLWDTGNATALMLTLQIVLVIFLNAVFQDGRGDAPYGPWLRRVLRTALVVLPLYTLLCVYALYLRIDQYGWSTDRVWASLLTFVVGLYVLGYAFSAIQRGAVWMRSMATVNVGIAMVLVLLVILVNSPVSDPRRISVHSQVARLLAGTVLAANFDYTELRFRLGAAGLAALRQLQSLQDHPEASAIRESAEEALNMTGSTRLHVAAVATEDQLYTHLVVYPTGTVLDKGMVEHFLTMDKNAELQRCFLVNQHCAVLAADLNGDGRDEYAVFENLSPWEPGVRVYGWKEQQWGRLGNLRSPLDATMPDDTERLQNIERRLQEGRYHVTVSPWRDLTVGDVTHQFAAD